MLDQDEGHAGVGRQRAQELSAGFEPARRSADADDHESPGANGSTPRRQGMPGSGPVGFG